MVSRVSKLVVLTPNRQAPIGITNLGMGPDDVRLRNETKYCCGLFSIRCLFIAVVVIDVVFNFNASFFLGDCTAKGPELYAEEQPLLVPITFGYGLVPFFLAVALTSMITALLSLISLQTGVPHWVIPYFICSIAYTALCFCVFIRATSVSPKDNWVVVVISAGSVIWFFFQVFGQYVKFNWFWSLVRKRRAISAATEIIEVPQNATVECPPQPSQDPFDPYETYSNRSTVVMTEEYYLDKAL